MKLLYVITMSNWGGAQAHLYDLVKHAITQNHECVVVVGEPGELTDRLKALGVKVIVLKSLVRNFQPIKDLKCVFDLSHILAKEKPDLVHAHSSKAGIAARIAAKLRSVPVIFTVHGWAFTEGVEKRKRSLFIFIERWVARFTNKIICVSEYDRRLAIDNNVGKPNDLITIVNGVEPTNFTHERKVVEGPTRIIMVARFSSQKDYETLTLALSMLTGDFVASYVGEGELLENVRLLAKDRGIENKIKFLGMRNDVIELLEQSDIFVLASNYEGLPISIIEAMSKHLPIIATNVGGIKELVADGETGFLTNRNDVEGLVGKLQYFLDFPEERIHMGEASYQKFKSEFTLEIMLDKTFAVYQEVLKGKRK